LDLQYQLGSSDSNSAYTTVNPVINASASLSLEVPVLKIWTPFYFRKNLTQAEFDAKMAELRHSEKVEETILRTVELYLDREQAGKEMGLKEQAYRNAVETSASVRSKRKTGAASSVEEWEALGAESRTQVEWMRAKEALQEKTDQLVMHVFANMQVVPEIAEGLQPAVEEQAPQSESPKLSSLPQVRRAAIEVEKAQLGWDAARKDLLPEVTLSAGSSAAGLAADAMTANQAVGSLQYPSYSAGLSVAMPLARSAARGTARSAQLRLEVQRVRELQVARNLELDVRRLQREIESGVSRMKALEGAVRAETQNYEAKTKFHRNGRITTSELNRTLEDKLQAELELLKSRISRQKAFFHLARLQGRLTEVVAELQ